MDIQRLGSDAGNGVQHQNGGGLGYRGGDGLDVVHGAGRGLGRLQENPFDGRLLGQRLFHLGRRHHLAIGNGQGDHLKPVRLADFRPAFAELAGYAGNDLVALREQVRDGSIHRARARGGKHQHVVGGTQHLLEVREAGTVCVAEILCAMVNVRRHHGMQRRWVQRGGTRS